MTSEPQYFFSYTEFQQPIPVSGIGNSTLHARGSGTIYLQSLPDINNTSIHQFDNVWLVPGLNDSIISKHWTKQHGLTTTLDDQENIILRSNNPKSTFKTTTQSIGKITVFPHVQALQCMLMKCEKAINKETHDSLAQPIKCPCQYPAPLHSSPQSYSHNTLLNPLYHPSPIHTN